MFNVPGIISSELRFPTETSKKKKRYVTFVCSVCGEVCEQTYEKSKFKGKCKYCSRHSRDTSDFIVLGRKHFGNKYDYSQAKYRGGFHPITIICPEHGEFTQRAQEHMDGHGCIKCAQAQRREAFILPKEVWLQRMEKYPRITFKETAQIKNYCGQVDIVCEIHGDFNVALGQVGKSKYLCPKCAHFAHQPQSVRSDFIGSDAYLYYIYLPEIGMYKFGVTLDIVERFKSMHMKVTPLLQTRREYTKAVALEHKIFTQLEEYRYRGGRKIIKNGSTELFTQNVIQQIQRALQE